MVNTLIQMCKITYKGIERRAQIVDRKFDKVKLVILDGSGFVIHTNWFDVKEIKRIWR